MGTDLNGRLERIFKAARGETPDTTRVETGFETRLMARIRAEREKTLPWYAAAWKLVPIFSAATVALGVWFYVSTPDYTADMGLYMAAGYGETTALNLLSGE